MYEQLSLFDYQKPKSKRTRNKSYEDWGLSESEVIELLKKMQSYDDKARMALVQTTHEVYPELADDIYYSLVEGVSYDRLVSIKDIPLDKQSFYGYRRKVIALFKERMGLEL